MKIQIFQNVPESAMKIRISVFVREQGFVDKPDEIDMIATHFLLLDDNGEAIATCRVFKNGKEHEYVLGRFAVVESFRNRGLGSTLLAAAEEHVKTVGGKTIILHSQLPASDFYLKNGYSKQGNVELEQGRPHVWMMKSLN